MRTNEKTRGALLMTEFVVRLGEGRQSKPVTERELRKLLQTGKVNGKTEVRSVDESKWQTVNTVLQSTEDAFLEQLDLDESDSYPPRVSSPDVEPVLPPVQRPRAAARNELDSRAVLKAASGRVSVVRTASLLMCVLAVFSAVGAVVSWRSGDKVTMLTAIGGTIGCFVSGAMCYATFVAAAHSIATFEWVTGSRNGS